MVKVKGRGQGKGSEDEQQDTHDLSQHSVFG